MLKRRQKSRVEFIVTGNCSVVDLGSIESPDLCTAQELLAGSAKYLRATRYGRANTKDRPKFLSLMDGMAAIY